MRIITTTDALAAFCAELRTHDYVAVDTEFMRESTYWPLLCLVQAAAGDAEAVIDPLAEGIDLAPLFEVFDDPAIMKVFHAARQDLEIFVHMHGRVPAPLFDSQVAAAAVGLGDSIAYDTLVRVLLDASIDKTSRFTDWSRRPLSEKQLAYALSDVTYLRDLYPILSARLMAAERGEWVAEEMAVLTDPGTYALEPDDAWARLKVRKRTKPYLAALKVAARWREQEAQTRNVPRQRVLKDDALYEIAMQGVDSAEALGRLRAVPKGFERSKAGQALGAVLAEALATPDAFAPKLPRQTPTPAGAGPTLELLKVLLRVQAQRHDVAPRLIATAADLERLAADDAADIPALRGWRREVFGQAALDLKHGRSALYLADGQVRIAERTPAV